MEQENRKPAWMRWGAVAVGLVVAVLIALWLKDMLTPKGPLQKMKVQQITLVKPPPPPPPPPEQKPPEPQVKEEVKVDRPEPTPEPKPAEAAPAPLNVGEGAEGGIDVGGTRGTPTLAGTGGERGGNAWGWYGALLSEAANAAVQQALARDQALKGKSYKVVIHVWLDSAGKVSRASLVDSTGDARVDEILKDALRDMRALREAPPGDMPQPVKVRVTSRA